MRARDMVIVPNREFKESWNEQLSIENVKTVMSDYNKQPCFFLRRILPNDLKPSDSSEGIYHHLRLRVKKQSLRPGTKRTRRVLGRLKNRRI